MTTEDEYTRCHNCGEICDGGVCDTACADELQAQQELCDEAEAEYLAAQEDSDKSEQTAK